jgi:hypothetical protein
VLPGQSPVNHLKTHREDRRRVQSILQIKANLPRRVHYYKPWFLTWK